jgi:hypothetical protein
VRGQALWGRVGAYGTVHQRIIGGWSGSCEDGSARCNELLATQASFGLTGITTRQGWAEAYLAGGVGLLDWDRNTLVIEGEIGLRGPSGGDVGVLFGVRALAMPWDSNLADDPVLEAVLGLLWRVDGG